MRQLVFCLLVFSFVFNAYSIPEIHHVSFDGTQDIFVYVNKSFQQWYKDLMGRDVSIKQYYVSNRYELLANIISTPADIISSLYPINLELLSHELVGTNDEVSPKKLLRVESPGYVIFNFVVRSGNPREILGWQDLIHNDINIVSHDYFYSNVGRMIYLNAWLYTQEKYKNEYSSLEYISAFVGNTILQTMSIGVAEESFVSDNIGDVFITTEINAEKLGAKQGLERIVPSLSFRNDIHVYIDEDSSNQDYTDDADAIDAYVVFLQTEKIQSYLANNGIYNDTMGAMTQVIMPSHEGKEFMIYLEHFEENGILSTIRRNLRPPQNTRAQEDLNP